MEMPGRKAWRRGESPAHCSYRLSRRRRVGWVAPDAELDEAERERRVGPALLKSQNTDRFQNHSTRAIDRSESLELPMHAVGVKLPAMCVTESLLIQNVAEHFFLKKKAQHETERIS